MNNYGVFLEKLINEINYQAEKWADGTWDGLANYDFDNNSMNDMALYIIRYASKWNSPNSTNEEFQECMIKVAALAYSAYVLGQKTIDTFEEDDIE